MKLVTLESGGIFQVAPCNSPGDGGGGQLPRTAFPARTGGVKGERLYGWAAARLPAATEADGDEPSRQRWMLARRGIGRPDEIACYLACAPLEATVTDLVRVAGCRWKIEECFQSAKNECGLEQYEVRRYVGRYRHITPCSPTPSSP